MTDTRRWPARDERLQWMAIAVLTVIAIALRVYRLTEWSLHDDEYSTWKNSLELSWSNPRPLLFALNHYLVWPLFGLRELGLRLIPVTAGVVAVPAFYVMLRRVNMGTEGLAAAALVAVSTWHVYWSQFARYYTLVFLLSAVCGLALLGWLRNRRGGWLGLAAASGVLATLAHPSALPVVGTGALIVGLNEYRNNRRLSARDRCRCAPGHPGSALDARAAGRSECHSVVRPRICEGTLAGLEVGIRNHPGPPGARRRGRSVSKSERRLR